MNHEQINNWVKKLQNEKFDVSIERFFKNQYLLWSKIIDFISKNLKKFIQTQTRSKIINSKKCKIEWCNSKLKTWLWKLWMKWLFFLRLFFLSYLFHRCLRIHDIHNRININFFHRRMFIIQRIHIFRTININIIFNRIIIFFWNWIFIFFENLKIDWSIDISRWRFQLHSFNMNDC